MADTQLYEKRKAVFPKAVKGPFRTFKWVWMAITLAIYYITPWLRWDRGPYAPDQAVLIDLAHQRFYMFSIEIWPHEFYFVAGLLIMAGIGLFLITSAVGRAWCGYSCPQTVWTDIFQTIDRWVDGDRNAQMRLQNAPWTVHKIAKRCWKWSIYLLISFLTGGAWILYFADAPMLFQRFFTGDAPSIAYATVGTLTLTTFTLGGFMREQVCIYMCPWPRIQGAMLDEKSLVVTYKDWRGEPRGSVKAAAKSSVPLGDCVDCNQCVAVCPTGIDIREGPQIGCITCGLCIDACDTVMEQVHRPRGLIDYATLDGSERERKGEPPLSVWKLLITPRTIIYAALWGGLGLGLLFFLGTRNRVDIAVEKDRNPPFIQMSNGDIRNAYTIKVRNMQNRPRTFEIVMEGLGDAKMWRSDMQHEAAARVLEQKIAPDQVGTARIYVIAPRGTAQQEFGFYLKALDEEGGEDRQTTVFTAPGGQ